MPFGVPHLMRRCNFERGWLVKKLSGYAFFGNNMADFWTEIAQILKESLPAGWYKVWVAPLEAEISDHVLTLKANNDYAVSWIERKLLDYISRAAEKVLGADGKPVSVVVCTRSTVHAKSGKQDSSEAIILPSSHSEEASTVLSREENSDKKTVYSVETPKLEQYSLPISTAALPLTRSRGWRHNFDDFVIGPTNEMAVAGAKEICRSHGCVETLFVSAPSGLGKTHLAQAVGNAISLERGAERIGYLTAEDFTSRFVAAMRQNELETFKGHLRNLDVLLLEDVHFLQGKEKMQEHVLSTVKYLQERGSRVVLTSSFAPRDLSKIDSHLVSQFCSGLMTSIERPNSDMRRAILEHKARIHQVILPPDVTDLLADRLSEDVRQLESCLNSLVFKAKLLNRHISLDMALDVLGQYAQSSGSLNFETIVRLVCESFGLSEHKLGTKTRRAEYVLGRNTVYFLARKHTELSLQQIGDKLNRRHSTVIKGITSIEREISRESRIGRQVSKTVSLIESNAGVA